jgi:hypothetical protein
MPSTETVLRRPRIRPSVLAVTAIAALAAAAVVVPTAPDSVDAAQAAGLDLAPVSLLAEKSNWSYFAQAPDDYPGDAWTEQAYDDDAWPSGPAPLGYNPKSAAVGIATTIGFGDDTSAKWPVALFRHDIEVDGADIADHTAMRLSLKADDSAVVFVNGEPVTRVRYDADPIDMTDYSGRLSDDATTYESYDVDIDDANLVDGANTIAVAVFQQVGTSSDLTFDLGLSLVTVTDGDIVPEQMTLSFNGDTTNRKGIAWQTPDAAGSDVRYVKSVEEPSSFADALRATGESSPVPKLGGYAHKVVLTDLEPSSTYWYQVGDADRGVWSDPARLATANDDGVVSFSMLDDSQGSNRADYAVAAKTFAKARELDPDSDFLVQNGDMVDDSASPDHWRWLYSTGQSTWSNNTFLATAGNHDATSNTYFSHYAIDSATPNTESGAYYSVDYDDVHLVVLNTNDIVDKKLGPDQTAWLTDDITAAKAAGSKWVVVIVHKGTQSVANHIADDDVKGMRTQLQPLFAELGVDMLLAGHDHTYTRSRFMDGPLPTTVNEVERDGITTAVNPTGTLYLTANSTGVKFYEPSSPEVIAANGVYPVKYGQDHLQMFANFEIAGDRLTFRSYEYDQAAGTTELYDAYSILKDADDGSPTTPDVPRKLSTSSVTGTSATVDWAGPDDDGGSAVTGYTVTTRTTDGTIVSSSTTPDTRSVLTGLNPHTAYRVTVAAVNGAGTGAPASVELRTAETTVPSAPRGVTVAGTTASGVTLAWTAPESDGDAAVSGYTVELRQGATTVARQTVTGTSATFGSLTAGAAYTATVTATNAVGSGPAETVAFSTLSYGAPAVSVTELAWSSARVSWAVSGHVAATVTVKHGASVVRRIATWADAGHVDVTGLTARTGYTAEVSIAGYGAGETSTPIAFSTPVRPAVASDAVKVRGTLRVGSTLSVAGVKTGWTRGAKLSYQWYANGKKIAKATKSTLHLHSAQKGKKIRVVVTGTKGDWKKAVEKSPTTKVVKAAAKAKKK